MPPSLSLAAQSGDQRLLLIPLPLLPPPLLLLPAREKGPADCVDVELLLLGVAGLLCVVIGGEGVTCEAEEGERGSDDGEPLGVEVEEPGTVSAGFAMIMADAAVA